MWKVVAADDEGYIREALKKLINWEKMNCDLVSVLEDGQELIQCIENESPDIVITDIQMPGVNGLEVCKYLYETRPETQVIILTAYSDFDYAKFAIKYNACEYVLKISIMDELPALGRGRCLLGLHRNLFRQTVCKPYTACKCNGNLSNQ